MVIKLNRGNVRIPLITYNGNCTELVSQSRAAVAEAQGQFGCQEEGQHLPLEAPIEQQLVKVRLLTLMCVCVCVCVFV
jgi:hypothetical protein